MKIFKKPFKSLIILKTVQYWALRIMVTLIIYLSIYLYICQKNAIASDFDSWYINKITMGCYQFRNNGLKLKKLWRPFNQSRSQCMSKPHSWQWTIILGSVEGSRMKVTHIWGSNSREATTISWSSGYRLSNFRPWYILLASTVERAGQAPESRWTMSPNWSWQPGRVQWPVSPDH